MQVILKSLRNLIISRPEKKKATDHTLFRKGNQCNKPVKGMSSTYGTG